MSERPISPLRRRMLEDMTVRGSARRPSDYIRHIKNFTAFLGRSPDTATAEDVRRFQVHLRERAWVRHRSTGRPRRCVSSFTTLIDLRSPGICARTHARSLYRAALTGGGGPSSRRLRPGLKYKAALSIAYGAGLRVCEVVMLQASAISTTKRMLIRVEQGKGRKDRHAMLSPQLLELLRAWWLQCRSKGWLFPSRDPLLPITTRQLNRVCHIAAEAAGLGTWVVAAHASALLRHAPAGEQH